MQDEPHYTQAFQEFARGDVAEAERTCRRILQSNPDSAPALSLLGLIAHQGGYHEPAIELLNRSIAIHPHVASFSNLAAAYRALGRHAEAEASYRRVLAMTPNEASAYTNLGNLMWETGRMDHALEFFHRALEIRKDFIPALSGLMMTLGSLGRTDEALDVSRAAIQAGAKGAQFNSNLGISYAQAGELDAAIRHFEHAISIDPNAADAHYGLSQVLLLTGDFDRGWREHEWRWQARRFPSTPRHFRAPQWDGSAIGDRTVLVHAEQGLGDAIMFARYLPMVAQRSRVIVECQAELVALFRTIPAAQIIPRSAPLGEIDFHIPMLSLPLAFGTALESIPADVPYLKADAERVRSWKERLADDQKLRVGLVWKGTPTHVNDCNRSIPLEVFSPLREIPGVSLYSLQKGESGTGLIDHSNEFNDLSDTAALVSCLDLVISVDTSVAHLAGALARPAWTLLPFAPDWRWTVSHPDDTPWYPTMRLFRQPRPRTWDAVIARVGQSLRSLTSQPR